MADATSLEFALPEDESQTDRLAALVDLHGLAVIGADHAKRIVEWSPAAARLFGYSESDALPRTLADLFTDQAAVQIRLWLDGLRDRGIDNGGPPLEWEARHADGRTFAARVTIALTAGGFAVLVWAPTAAAAAAGAVVALLDSKGRRRDALVLGLRSEATEEPGLARSLRQLGSELARDALETGEPFFVPVASRWNEIEALPARLRSLACPGAVVPPLHAVPIRGGGAQPAGAFCVLGRDPFDDTDLAAFHDIAALISGTVKDESLYRRQKELATRGELTRLYRSKNAGGNRVTDGG